MRYKTIVGLEIHAQLMTNTKAFCSCNNEYGNDPNTNVCPICLGMPGALPVLNKSVVDYSIKAGLAFNCDINKDSKMDRKNYFYPDLTKGYQISQQDTPICENGYIEITGDSGEPKKVGLIRIHMEEDTGKSIHTDDEKTLVDYNRAGVPLIEIVTKPEINSGNEAKEFLESLRATLKYIDVSDCKMEEGSLRCDVNVNIVDTETNTRSTIAEIKNLNSFRAVEKAIEFETNRQIAMLENGETEVKSTRRWDDSVEETILMREKLVQEDYRFASEGDLMTVELSDEDIERIRATLPELIAEKKARFMSEYDLNDYDATVLTADRSLSKYYEELAKVNSNYSLVSNWVINELLRRVESEEFTTDEIKFSVSDFNDLLNLVESNKINNNTGKKVFREMFETGKSPNTIVEEQGLLQISDTSFIEEAVDKVLSDNPQSIIDFKAGKDRALGFLVGQVMKATKGKANPQMVNELLSKKMSE
ncbi:MAG: Asp-tRNA(Asn)/Glu-tRNA(Gln) amidotransferase subunit GatB [Tissierellia bacterium]|nr:Asp-tRNA(Asn)/Glu-tRNA(Gln) amidotransferase subunit GatB [Tissierellia bacterium]